MTAPTVQERIAAHNRRMQAEWRYRQAMCGWHDTWHMPSDFETPAPRVTHDAHFGDTLAQLFVWLAVVVLLIVLVAAIRHGGA